jgi:prepilin-type N-terminal cleavage/methylation domain-containing protein
MLFSLGKAVVPADQLRTELMRNKKKGFSLIELLVVVAIIMVIVAMAIPNLLRTRMTANETSAVNSMSTLNSACVTYLTIYGGYPAALSNLGSASAASATSADLIDSVLAGGTRNGYNFTYAAGPKDANGRVNSYAIKADPSTPGTTGQRSFFTDQSGTIRSNNAGPADVSSTPIT